MQRTFRVNHRNLYTLRVINCRNINTRLEGTVTLWNPIPKTDMHTIPLNIEASKRTGARGNFILPAPEPTSFSHFPIEMNRALESQIGIF